MKNYINILAALLLVSLTTACNKTECPEPMGQTQSLTLRLTPVVGTDTLKYNTSFTTENNVRYTLSTLRYYMSDIRLVRQDGSEYVPGEKVLLVNAQNPAYVLGDVPAGTYKGIRFSVGLDYATNHRDPTVYQASHPLAIQTPSIHWSWNSGYIFLSMEGTCDTTDTNTDVLTYGQYSHGMFFHVGMDPLLRNVTLTENAFTVSATEAKVLNIHYDINKLFTGVDMKTENQSHTMGSMPLATKVANNIPGMFTIRE